MKRFLISLIIGSASLAQTGLHAEDKFPSKPVRIVVPFTAGGVGDTIARIIGTPLGENLGQPVIIDNRPGGDSVMGTEFTARATPDGYTLLQVSTPQVINMVLRDKLGYDLLRDFAPVSRAVSSTLVLVVSAKSPYKTVADLVAQSKIKTDGLSYGSGAIGSVGHLSGELFKRAAGIAALHVPYKGNSSVIPDLVGGRLDFLFASQPEAVQGAAAGLLRPLAVTAPRRVATFPDVPTMVESKFPGFEPSSNYGYMAPINTPAAVVKRLNEAFAKTLASADVQARLQALGLTPNFAGPDEWAGTLKSELKVWGGVVKAANIRAE